MSGVVLPVACAGAQVAFDYQGWVTAYPEFSSVPPPTAQAYFDRATLYLKNDGTGPVRSAAQQTLLLGLLTAHIAKLSANQGGQGSTTVVGRVDSITVGPATISAQLDMPMNAQFFALTTYGVQFWFATAYLRTFRWRRGPRRVIDPWVGPYPWGGGWGSGWY